MIAKAKKVGLYFGSFNPIHVGHMVVANFMREFAELDQVWFVISPQNPLKQKKSLLADHHRYEMVYRALGDQDHYKPSRVEFGMPLPSYTIDTLEKLREKHPHHQFFLIMGGDNLLTFHKWKDFEKIYENNELLIYPRPGYDLSEVLPRYPKARIVEAPLMEISSTFIRENLSKGRNLRYFMSEAAYEYLESMNFYR